jgi:hypothetical protein
LLSGIDEEAKQQLGIVEPDYYNYLNVHGCFKVDSNWNQCYDFKTFSLKKMVKNYPNHNLNPRLTAPMMPATTWK